MAELWWVGGGSSTNWNATEPTNWSLTSGGDNDAPLPASGDYVYFNSSADCRVNLNPPALTGWDMTGYTGAMSASGVRTVSINPDSDINLIFEGVAGHWFSQIKFTISGSNTVQVDVYQNLSGGNDGERQSNLTFNNSNATIKLMTDLRCSAWNFTNGTLDANSKKIELFDRAISSFFPVNFGGQTYYDVNITSVVNAVISYINSSGTFDFLTFDSLYNTIYYFVGQTLTVNNTLVIKNQANLNGFRTPLYGVTLDLTDAETIDIDNAVLNNVSFIAAVDIDLSAKDVGDLSGNSINGPHVLTFPAGTTQNWTNTGTGVLNVRDAANWTSRVPLPQDNAIIATSHSDTVQFLFELGNHFFGTLDFSGCTSTENIVFGATPFGGQVHVHIADSFIGNSKLASMESGFLYQVRFHFAYSPNAYVEQIPLIYRAYFYIYNGTTLNVLDGTVNIQEAVEFTRYSSLNANGVLNLGGNTLTCSDIVGGVNVANSGSINIDSGNLVLVGNLSSIVFRGRTGSFSITDNIDDEITITRTLTATFGTTSAGNGFSLGTVTVTGSALFRQNHSFKRLNVYNAGNANGVLFYRGLTYDINSIDSNGEAGALTVIKSDSTTNATLNYTGSGPVELDYIDASYITGTPESTWYVGNNSIDNGNNVNLIFSSLPKIKSVVGQVFLSLKKVNGVSSFKKVLGIGTPKV